MRSLLDIRLSRFSLGLLAIASAIATVVIVTSGSTRTPAQLAALAALHEPPAARAQTVAQTPAPQPAPATTQSAAPSPSDSSAPVAANPAPASDPSPAPAADDSDDSEDTGDTDTTTTSTTASTTTATPASTLPKVGHVFEIALSTPSYKAAFGHASPAPYLRSLVAKGTLLSGYKSLGHGELADELAMVSGQKPNPDTSAGCTTYLDFPQSAVAKVDGLVPGRGCVYPETALTIGDQVSSKGDVWRAYVADMGKETCSHPNSGSVDDLALPGTEPGYDTRHNPFIYFHSLLDLGDCATDDLDLSRLPAALAHQSRTATLSFIAPGACDDATATATTSVPTTPTTTTTGTTSTGTASTSTTTTATTSTGITTTGATTTGTTSTGTPTSSPGQAPATSVGCPAGQPVGIAGENAFLKLWVPRILASAAYRDNGVLIIAFSGDPLTPARHVGRVGALVLSRYAHKATTIATAYQPYSLLHAVEGMLGYTVLARAKSAPSFAEAVLHKSS